MHSASFSSSSYLDTKMLSKRCEPPGDVRARPPFEDRSICHHAGGSARYSWRVGRIVHLLSNLTLKAESWPSRLSTAIDPPRISLSAFISDRPRPVPPYLRVVEASAWTRCSQLMEVIALSAIIGYNEMLQEEMSGGPPGLGVHQHLRRGCDIIEERLEVERLRRRPPCRSRPY